MSATKELAADLARLALGAMRGGPILAASPQRSEAILAEAFAKLIDAAFEVAAKVRAEEREACAKIAEMYGARDVASAIREQGES